MARAPGTRRLPDPVRSMWKPPRRPPSPPSRAARPASTTLPMTMVPSPSTRRAASSASTLLSGSRPAHNREKSRPATPIEGGQPLSEKSCPSPGFERLADEARAGEAEAPRMLDRLGDADTRPGDDLRHAGACRDFERRRIEGKTVVRAADLQGFAQAPRSRAQEPLVGDAPPPAHGGEPDQRPKRANEHGAGAFFLLADEIETPMDAVRAVHVGEARRAEHHGVAGGLAAEGMRGRIGVVVGFDLGNLAADPAKHEGCTDQLGRNLMDAATKERTGEQGHRKVSRALLSSNLMLR